jgi:hypothetical protein
MQIHNWNKRSLSTLGLRNSRLTSHSFRIGRANTFAIEGLPDDEIKRLGRWESNAYLRYIRILTFCNQDHFHQCETIYNWEGLPVTIMFLYDSLTYQVLSRSCPATKY